MTKKKQYDLKEMEEISVLLTKQVQLLERVKELMKEIAEFKIPSTPTYFPYYWPNPNYWPNQTLQNPVDPIVYYRWSSDDT